MPDEYGWLIERRMGPRPGELRYWAGTGRGDQDFTDDHEAAIRFARKIDAEIVLSRLLKDCGVIASVVEHGWSDWRPEAKAHAD